MDEELSRIIMQFSVYTIFLPATVAFFRIKNGNRQQKILSVLIFVSVLIEVLALLIGQVFHKNNLPLLHIFTVLEFSILVFLFHKPLSSFFPKNSVWIWIGGFFLFSLGNSLFIESIFQFNAIAKGVESILCIILALLYFYQTLKTLEVRHLEYHPLFWISSGMLIYFSASLFMFIYSNYILVSESISFTIWGIHAFLSIVLNLFYFAALWVKPKT